MKRNKILAAISFLCLFTLLLPVGFASATVFRASKVFESGYVITGSDLYTEFGASTRKEYPVIYVSSCTLQEMDDNDKVVASTKLTPPSDKAENASDFVAWKTYSGTSGKKYRIKAVFSAGGETITRYSTTVVYKQP